MEMGAVEREEFNSLTGELEHLLTDPLVGWARTSALAGDTLVNEVAPIERPELIAQHIARLNAKWPYLGQIVKVSGRINVPDGENYVSKVIIDHPLVSRGFRSIPTMNTDVSVSMSARTYYEFETNIDDEDGRRKVIAVMLPEAMEAIELPYPSDELRIRRFLYDHAADAAYIDELAFKAARSDQILLDFGLYYLDIDIQSRPSDAEAARDAAAFLRQRAELEPHANYHLTFSGDVIHIDENGDGLPMKIDTLTTAMVAVRDIILHPADTSTADLSIGQHALVPYLDVVVFSRDDPSLDSNLLIPCSSLLKVRSARYQSDV